MLRASRGRTPRANRAISKAAERSRVDWTLPGYGIYRLVAASFSADATGTYRIVVRDLTPVTPSRADIPRTCGLFVGISDYPGVEGDLDYTADDADRIREVVVRTGMDPAEAITLTDGKATRSNLD